MTIERAMRAAAARLSHSASPLLDMRVLAGHVLGLDDAALIAEGARYLSREEEAALEAAVARRAAGEPVAHIIGRREFWSLDLEILPGILVPRADSETLIEAIVRRRSPDAPLRILDLGCGSGALIAALLSEFPGASGLAIDINPRAAALAARNLERLGFAARAAARTGDWLRGIEDRFDVIVANPPYIPAGDRDKLPREVRDFEDERALFAGEDGLAAYRRILDEAPGRLAPAALMALELGDGQAAAVKHLARRAFPNSLLSVEADLAGRARALVIDLASSGD